MTEEGFKRKLTAVLSADVAGYSRLMSDDEASTVKAITTYRGIMATLIKQHRGRMVDSPGDNVLAEFPSVVDAVQCAVAVQKEFHSRNAELPENRRMEFRIGINLGDVIEEEERIYGDGVNIAARLEALADPGGICVSKTAFDQIETKLPLGYEYLGEQTVKNIPKPVGAYRVLMEPRVTVAEATEEKKAVPFWRRKAILAGGVALVVVVIAALIWNFYFRPPPMEVASKEKMAFPLPDEPSIAVLPFVTMSEDKEQEYFSDGLTEEIISALSKVPKLLVIARNSTFTYKGKPVKVKQVSEELGVRYVLEGSVRKAGERVRVTAQLIDATTGYHLWSERYDRPMKDVFALQDEITKNVIIAMQVELTTGEYIRLSGKGTDNLDAYLKFLNAMEHFNRLTTDDLILARELFKEAIALDPEYAAPYSFIGQIIYIEVTQGRSKSPQKSIEQAFELAQKAITLDESDPNGHILLTMIYRLRGQYGKAMAAAKLAVSLNPNGVGTNFWLGKTLTRAGRPEEAIPYFKRAIRANPLNQIVNLSGLSTAYWVMGRYDEAITASKKMVQSGPSFMSVLANVKLAACYAALGREKESYAAAAEVLRLSPKFSLGRLKWLDRDMDQAAKERFIDALRKAGLLD